MTASIRHGALSSPLPGAPAPESDRLRLQDNATAAGVSEASVARVHMLH